MLALDVAVNLASLYTAVVAECQKRSGGLPEVKLKEALLKQAKTAILLGIRTLTFSELGLQGPRGLGYTYGNTAG